MRQPTFPGQPHWTASSPYGVTNICFVICLSPWCSTHAPGCELLAYISCKVCACLFTNLAFDYIVLLSTCWGFSEFSHRQTLHVPKKVRVERQETRQPMVVKSRLYASPSVIWIHLDVLLGLQPPGANISLAVSRLEFWSCCNSG